MGRATVAIIGAGFSGLLTALHLLADPDGPIVRLVERRGVFGRGVAYSSPNPEHLLNVRAANMSAFPDDPGHFVRWLARHPGRATEDGFVTRRVYGDYLQALLRRAAAEAGGERLLLEADEAVDLQPIAEGWQVILSLGRMFAADAVVLSIGALPSASPEGADPAVLVSPRYVADPWSLAPNTDLGRRVLLLGTGLTMVDVVLTHAAPGRRFIAISRRGLTPRAHVSGQVAPGAQTQPQGSPTVLLRRFRSAARTAGWREQLDGWRPHVQAVWAGWSERERRQALRHLGPWWDVHRHRMAPMAAREMVRLQAKGMLSVRAGRIERLTLADEQIRILWRRRGQPRRASLRVDTVINCTGACCDLRLAREPLIARLLARGLIQPDQLGMGARVDDQSRAIGAKGSPNPTLFAIGPLTRGAFLEITAVPDIRLQAQQVARRLSARRRA